MAIKLSIVSKRLVEVLENLKSEKPDIKSIKKLLRTFQMRIERDTHQGKISDETELTDEASEKFDTMLVDIVSLRDDPTNKGKVIKATESIKAFRGISSPYPTQDPLDTDPDTTASIPSKGTSAPAKGKSKGPDAEIPPTDQEKLAKVKAHLQRWAAVEQYASSAKRIGYGDHLAWLEENEKLAANKQPDKKAQKIVNAYTSMPGFGGQPDKHQFVDLHMEIELLELELAKLTAESAPEEEIKNKKSEIQTKQESLVLMLNEGAEKVNERLENEIKKNPDLEPYIRPVVDSYANWLESTDKFGTMPQLCVLDGPPGTGKTYIAQTLADILGIDLRQIPMSSESDTTLIPGRNKGWEDPKPGKVAELQIASKSQLFLFFSDELEKAEKPVINTHVDLFESGQVCYKDKFFNDLNVPKLFTTCVATTNDFDILPGHIKTRSKKIIVKGKKPEEKLNVIKKRLQKEISKKTRLKGKAIKFEPNEDELLLWFLKTYSSQPGYREDNQNVDKLVSELTKHFRKNNTATEFKVNKAFITKTLGPPSKRLAEKRHLWDTIIKIGEELDNHNKALNSACDKNGVVINPEDANKALAQQIVYRGLMRSNIQSLISILEQELKKSTDNKALLKPEIKRLKEELATFKEFTPLQIEFLSNNLANLRQYNLTSESLTKLINERLEKLRINIESIEKEILLKKYGSIPEKFDDAQGKLTNYKKEQETLQNLLKKMNLKEKELKTDTETKRSADTTSSMDSSTSTSTPPEGTITFTGTASTAPNIDSDTSSRAETTHTTPSTKTTDTASSPETTRTKEARRNGAKLSVKEGGILFFKHGVGQAIQQNPTIIVPATKPLTPALFKEVTDGLKEKVTEIQEKSKAGTLSHEDLDSFKGLTFKESGDTVSVARGSNDVMTIKRLEKSVEIESTDFKPEDDELYAMVLAAKITADRIGRPRFTIEHCGESPETAFKLYLIGKSMGLTPTFKDAPGKNNQTVNNIIGGEYGQTTLLAGSGQKTIAEIFKEVESGQIKGEALKEYIALLEHPGEPPKPKTS